MYLFFSPKQIKRLGTGIDYESHLFGLEEERVLCIFGVNKKQITPTKPIHPTVVSKIVSCFFGKRSFGNLDFIVLVVLQKIGL